jgi:hypothetical protein
MITDELLQDVMHTQLGTAIHDSVGSTLASLVFNYGQLPPNDRVATIIKNVLEAFSTLPGEHWLPDDL